MLLSNCRLQRQYAKCETFCNSLKMSEVKEIFIAIVIRHEVMQLIKKLQ